MGIDFVERDSSGDDFASVEKDFLDGAELPGFERLGEDVDLFFGDVLVDLFFVDVSGFEEEGDDATRGFLFDEWSDLTCGSFVFELHQAVLNMFEVEVRDEIDFEVGGFDMPVVADFAGDAKDAGTGEPGVGEEHIAAPLGDDFVLDSGFEENGSKGNSGFDLEILEREIDGGKGGEDGDDGVSDGFCPGVSIAGGAGFGET